MGSWTLGGAVALQPEPPGQRAWEGQGLPDPSLVTSCPAVALRCYSCQEPTSVSSCVNISTCKANETMCKTTLYSLELGQQALGWAGLGPRVSVAPSPVTTGQLGPIQRGIPVQGPCLPVHSRHSANGGGSKRRGWVMEG